MCRRGRCDRFVIRLSWKRNKQRFLELGQKLLRMLNFRGQLYYIYGVFINKEAR